MVRVLLIKLFLVIFSIAIAQPDNELDSLTQLLKSRNTTSNEKIIIFLELASYHIDGEVLKTLSYADSALKIIHQLPEYNSYLPEAYLMKGAAYKKQSIHDKALLFLNKGLEYATQYDNKEVEASIYGELARVAEMTSENVKALELNQKALDIHIESKDTLGIVEIYNSIGIIYWNKHEYDQALAYYKKAVALNNSTGDIVANARLTNNIGLIFQSMDQYDSALNYFRGALNYINPDQHKFGYALINNNLGINYRSINQYDQALHHFNIAHQLQLEMNDLYGLGLVNDNISRVYKIQGKYEQSLSHLKKGFKYAQQTGNMDLLASISGHMAEVYELIGDYKNAYSQQKLAKSYSDSLQEKSLTNELAELEVKYQVKQQQAENDLLKAENELNVATLKNKDFLVIASIIFSVLIFTLLVMAYRALRIRRKSSQIIEEKNIKLESLYKEVELQKESIGIQKNEIERQNTELTNKNKYLEELNYEKNSLMAIVAHDLKSPLNSIGGIANILPTIGPINNEQNEFLALISKVVESSRILIQDLMDLSALENKEIKVNLQPIAINEIIQSCQAKYTAQAQHKSISLAVSETIDDSIIINSDAQFIERVMQNLISNAIKFSPSGTTIQMGSKLKEGQIQFFVKDEGPGISTQDQKYLFRKFHKLSAKPTGGETSTGLGLSIVKVLMEELKGIIYVDSEVGCGSTFICALPLKY